MLANAASLPAIDAAVVRELAAPAAARCDAVPLRFEGHNLIVAVGSTDDEHLSRLAAALGRRHIVSTRFARNGDRTFSVEQTPDEDRRALLFAAYDLETPQPNAVSHISRDVALRYHVLPLRLENHAMFVGFTKPPSDVLLDLLGRESGGLEILPVLMPADHLHGLQHVAYRLDRVRSTGSAASVTPNQRATSYIERAVKMRAEDVHFESTAKGGRVRVNRGGFYTTLDELGPEEFRQVVGAIRGDASIDSGNDLEAVVGSKEYDFQGRRVEARLTTMPTESHAADHIGLQLVVRIHDVDAAPKRYKDLGMRRELATLVRSAFMHRNGMSVLVGPPDSGKNTLAVAMLLALPLEHMKVCTAESPAEVLLDYVQHHKVTLHNTYEKITARLMQLNTQVLYQAECLDEEGAKTIGKIGNYGRKGITTAHTDDCKSAIRRLLRLGLTVGDLAECLNMIIAQRLIRVVCRHCSTEVRDLPEFLRARRPDCTSMLVASDAGCEYCDYTGYSRKTGVFEVMIITEQIREAISAGKTALEIEAIAASQSETYGFRPLIEDALDRVVDHTTTMDEAVTVVSLRDDFVKYNDGDDTWWAG